MSATPNTESGLIAADTAARLLMISLEEFAKLARADWFTKVSGDRYRVVDVVQGYIKHLQDSQRSTGRSVADTAQHIDLGQRRFFELLDAGVIARQSKNGGYDLDEVRRIYIRHLRKVAAGRGAENDVDLSSERAKLAREQTEAVAIRNAVSRGEYVLVSEVVRQVESEYGIVRERLLTISGKCSDALVGRSREEIEAVLFEEVSEALNELHNPSVAERAGGVGASPASSPAGAQAAAAT